MNIRLKLENIIFNKMRKSCFKLTLLFGVIGGLLGGIVIGPINHEPTAFEVKFLEEDMQNFKEKGNRYSFKDEFEKQSCDWHVNEQIEKGTCIPYHFRHTTDFRRYIGFKKDEDGKRKGKVSCQFRDAGLSDAINRTIDENSEWNFDGGYLMKNSTLDSIGARHWSRTPDGYSIVTAGWEKFHACMHCGIVLGVMGFLLPLAFILGLAIIYSIIYGPGVWLFRAASRWAKWTFSDFSR